MKLELNELYIFKLLTGEELIAKVVGVEQDHLVIQHPISAVLSPQGLQLMPSLFTANLDANVQLNNAAWAMISQPRDDVRNSWIQATTGIAPVSKQIITG